MQMNDPNQQKEILGCGNASEARISPLRKKRRIWIGVLAALLAGGVVWLMLVLVLPRPKELVVVPLWPKDLVYDGHRLSWWLTNSVMPREIQWQIDSKAAPYLVYVMARRDGWWRKVYTNLPAAFKNRIPSPSPAALTSARAAWLLGRVQPASPQTVRALIRVVQKDDDIQVRLSAIESLGSVANGNEEAVARTDTSDFVRTIATRTLGATGSTNRLAIQTLIQLATNSASIQWVRSEAISALGNLHLADPNTSEAVSKLSNNPN